MSVRMRVHSPVGQGQSPGPCSAVQTVPDLGLFAGGVGLDGEQARGGVLEVQNGRLHYRESRDRRNSEKNTSTHCILKEWRGALYIDITMCIVYALSLHRYAACLHPSAFAVLESLASVLKAQISWLKQ